VVTGRYDDLWVYLVGPVIGAVAAALLYRGALAPEK
jgi:glycerol uptake facilitator-like aquaporin